ncbi:MAG: hypothetical protein Tsb002_02830 [Wenzhouxiangellaceae bacterium]
MRLRGCCFGLLMLCLAFSGRAQDEAPRPAALDPSRQTVEVEEVGPAVQAAETPRDKAQVHFDQPQSFLDFRDDTAGRDQGRPLMIAELDRFVRELADQFLPQGQYLQLTFTDIDLAGRQVPIRGTGRFQRVIEDFYPPRLSFHYQIVDEDNKVLEQGEEKLVNFSFLRLSLRARFHRQTRLPYEKALLEEWFRDHFEHFADEAE